MFSLLGKVSPNLGKFLISYVGHFLSDEVSIENRKKIKFTLYLNKKSPHITQKQNIQG